MTIQQIIDWFGSNPRFILNYFIFIFIIALLGLLFVKPHNFKGLVKYFYSAIIYAVSVPAILSAVLTMYNIFFLKYNLLNLDVLSYFVPIIGCILSLVVVNKTVPMRLIPGFKNLSGLFILILLTFFVTYILQKMFFGVIFIGSFSTLLLLFLGVLVIMAWAWNRIFK